MVHPELRSQGTNHVVTSQRFVYMLEQKPSGCYSNLYANRKEANTIKRTIKTVWSSSSKANLRSKNVATRARCPFIVAWNRTLIDRFHIEHIWLFVRQKGACLQVRAQVRSLLSSNGLSFANCDDIIAQSFRILTWACTFNSINSKPENSRWTAINNDNL